MDDAAAVRDAARAVLEDVEPPRLRELLGIRIQEAAVTPGVLTRMSARAAGGQDAADLDCRVAGVQLIYEGLSLTRSIARSPPWERDATDEADLTVLVANVLVARGFYLLARTEAADTAVECVRAFGRDETTAEGDPDRDVGPGALETDLFELAIVSGASTVGASHHGSRALAADLVQSLTSIDDGLPDGTDKALEMLLAGETPANAARDGIEASSATDL